MKWVNDALSSTPSPISYAPRKLNMPHTKKRRQSSVLKCQQSSKVSLCERKWVGESVCVCVYRCLPPAFILAAASCWASVCGCVASVALKCCEKHSIKNIKCFSSAANTRVLGRRSRIKLRNWTGQAHSSPLRHPSFICGLFTWTLRFFSDFYNDMT